MLPPLLLASKRPEASLPLSVSSRDPLDDRGEHLGRRLPAGRVRLGRRCHLPSYPTTTSTRVHRRLFLGHLDHRRRFWRPQVGGHERRQSIGSYGWHKVKRPAERAIVLAGGCAGADVFGHLLRQDGCPKGGGRVVVDQELCVAERVVEVGSLEGRIGRQGTRMDREISCL